MAPSPKPATKIWPSTCSDVKEVTHEPERAGISCYSKLARFAKIMLLALNVRAMKSPYTGANFQGCVPNPNDSDVTRY